MKRTKEEALATRQHIIDTARKMFLKNGYSNTKLDHIASEANVTRGAIYWHFKDKLDLVKAITATEMKSLHELFMVVFTEDLPAGIKVRNIIKAIVNNFYDNASYREYIELTWFRMEYTQLSQLLESRAGRTAFFIREYEKIIKEAQKEGMIRSEISSMDITLTLTNLINGMYRMYFLLPQMMSTKDKALAPFNSYLNLISTETHADIRTSSK